mmetsp:Transcript_65829/g.174555  ORF Transcript_65829/g.174555 Transcript_65829/m.174555 type:complete len:105 (-) Transcript_65829:482-796(-)
MFGSRCSRKHARLWQTIKYSASVPESARQFQALLDLLPLVRMSLIVVSRLRPGLINERVFLFFVLRWFCDVWLRHNSLTRVDTTFVHWQSHLRESDLSDNVEVE